MGESSQPNNPKLGREIAGVSIAKDEKDRSWTNHTCEWQKAKT